MADDPNRRAGATTAVAGPTTIQPTWQEIEAGRRPAPFHLLFMMVMLWMLSSRSDGLEPVSDEASLAQMHRNIRSRELRRDGLARWLGVNETYASANSSAEETPIDFVLRGQPVPTLLPTLKTLMKHDKADQLYPQNVTGFIHADWHFARDWSIQRLGLNETYNTTRLVMPPRPTVPYNVALLTGNKAEAGTNSTEEERKPINETITVNRTDTRGFFGWQEGGRVSVSLREDYASVSGPVLLPTRYKDGDLLEYRHPRNDWEKQGPVSYVSGDVTFTSRKDGTREVQLDFEGVHLLKSGHLFAYITPPSHRSHIYDLVHLPAFADTHANMTMTAIGHSILKEADQRIEKEREERSSAGLQVQPVTPIGDITDDGVQAPDCDLAFFGSIEPIHLSPDRYAEYYRNLHRPTGASVEKPRHSRVRFIVYSESCAFVLEGEGDLLARPDVWNRAATFAIVMTAVEGVIIWLLIKQMETSRSPGERSKVAYWTVGVQAFLDAWFFVISFTVGIVTKERASMPMLIPAFFSLGAALIFGMRFASVVRAAQPPRPSRPARPAATTTPASNADGSTENLLGGESSAMTENTGMSVSDRRKFALGVMIIGSAAFTLFAYGWLALCLSVFYSYWVPQIVANVDRGAARSPLRRDYIVGTTLARLVLPLYIWACPQNLLYVQPSRWVFALTLWSLVQAAVLLIQNTRLGPRFFLTPFAQEYLGLDTVETWDWHPPLPEDLESASQLVCPICMEPIETGTKEEKEAARAGFAGLAPSSARFGYMVPPCHHIAHTNCLESWLAIKSVCPVCRGPLPPL